MVKNIQHKLFKFSNPAKHKKTPQEILLSEGILLSGSFSEQREKRWTDFFVRAFSLFAIVTGSLGGMLSGFDIAYDKKAFFAAAFLSALYCSSLYFSVIWENIGYILVFLFVLNAGIGLRTYVSSGFYGILNDISAAATSFFETSAEVSYAEQVGNHSFAISVAMCYFALIGCIFTNGLLSRKMRYVPVAFFSTLLLLVPIYLEKEPSGGYAALLAAGIITVYILRQNLYLCQNTRTKAYRNLCRKAAKKHLFSGNFSGRAALTTMLAITILCAAIAGVTRLFIPKNTLLSKDIRSAFKLRTMDAMENFYLLGVMGLINFYPTTGGLVNGRLGGVNSVRLDYETDLTLEFVPYTYDRIYLKTFVGTEYVPYQNHWARKTLTEGWEHDTAQRLKDAYLAGQSSSARGAMTVRNVAAMSGIYQPYYSMDTAKIRPGMQHDYIFFPQLTAPRGTMAPVPADSQWLEIPEANQAVIADFCVETGLSGSRDKIVSQLRAYFQENYPYTLSPGITPRRKDFVNYFLSEKKKGYCAHYASAAVLILRHMGIPARYVEGYAVDAIDAATDGTLTNKDASDYYDGATMISQNSVISYDVSDGNAHAWVEIYDETFGWYPVEFTPFQTGEDKDKTSIWHMFLQLFQTGQDETHSAGRDPAGTDAVADALRKSAYGFVFCFILLFMTFPVTLLVRKCIWLYRYHKSGRSEKLLMLYGKTVHKSNLRRKFAECKNFEEQAAWLASHGFLTTEAASFERLVRTLNEAAYSQKEISGEAFDAAVKLLTHEK